LIRVLILDGDRACRDSLIHLLALEPGLAVLGAEDLEAGVATLDSFRPNVLLVDGAVPRDGAERLDQLMARLAPQDPPAVISLVVYPDQHDAALKQGAAIVLRKDCSRRELVDAIRSVTRPASPEARPDARTSTP
jgi:DNA-binding NarL/FixJ family response regulator